MAHTLDAVILIPDGCESRDIATHATTWKPQQVVVLESDEADGTRPDKQQCWCTEEGGSNRQ